MLLSDGKTTDGTRPARSPPPRAAKLQVPIYTVALGTPDGVITGPMGAVGRRSRRTPRRCAQIARASGGRAFAAADAGALDEVYEKLGSRIGTRTEKREVTAGFAAAGCCCCSAGSAPACAGGDGSPEASAQGDIAAPGR